MCYLDRERNPELPEKTQDLHKDGSRIKFAPKAAGPLSKFFSLLGCLEGVVISAWIINMFPAEK